jgi:glycosyltransferase involved in cell wall biosynthesis
MTGGRMIVAPFAVPDTSWDAERVLMRARVLARRGGGVLVAPVGEGGPVVEPGVRHLPLSVPVGLGRDQAELAVEDLLGPILDRLKPATVHVLGVPGGVPVLLRRRHGARLVVEPGITPSQWMRDLEPELPAERLTDLVAVEDKVLSRADAVVVRSAPEAATMAARGVPSDRLWTVVDAPPEVPEADVEQTELPHLVWVGDVQPWSGGFTLLSALARVKLPWQLTAILPADASTGALGRHARALHIAERVTFATRDDHVGTRVASVQAVVCPLLSTRASRAGGLVPEGTLWALGCGRALVAADLPVVRAYAGGAAAYHEPDDAGALAAAVSDVLGDPTRREDLVAQSESRRAALLGSDPDQRLADVWDAVAHGDDA